MEQNTPDVSAESSSAQTIAIPRSPEAYAEWRKTGNVTPPKREASATSNETTSAAAESGAGKDAPASEAGSTTQGDRKRGNAESRLNEILADLKHAGLSPAELKTFKKQAQAAAAEEKTTAATEHTEKPAAAEAPKEASYDAIKPKPKMEDFEHIEEFTEALTDWKADEREWRNERKAAAEKLQKEASEMLESAKERYGAEAETHIRHSATAIFQDATVPSVIKAMVNDSDVMADLLYTLGSKEEVAEFVALAKSKPGEAIRKLVTIEALVKVELAKGGGASAASSEEPVRGEDGKFVSSKPPAKKITDAPPPPREAGGRTGAPPDEVKAAAQTGDFRRFREAQNQRDLSRR